MIRELKCEDLDNVMNIWLEENCTAHSFIDEEYWKDNLEAVREMMPTATVFVYEENGVIVGFIGLMDQYIAGIFISNGYQSKGIGKQLMDYVKQRKQQLSLHVYKKNERAIEFYQREGFTISKEQLDENTGEVELVMNWNEL